MKKTVTLIFASLLAFGFLSFSVLSSGGISGKTTTGCSCHSPSANSNVTLTLNSPTSNLFTGGYLPGTTYTLNFKVQQVGQVLFGLDVKASAGTFIAGIDGETKIMGGEITHTGTANATANDHTFAFQWTAPASGSVTFTFAGNATNGNGANDSGDHWNKGSVTVSSATEISEHAISTLNLSVFPNPVTESAKVSYELAENSTVSANLINLNGQTVVTFFTKEEQKSGMQNKVLIVEPTLSKGIYFVAINVNGKNSYKKIVVQ